MIRIENLRKSHGGRHTLAGLSAHVAPGEAVAILGPSGSGKTTLLRCLNGLEPFEGGRISIAGFELRPGHVGLDAKDLVRLRRSVGFVFQEHELFPHLSVLRNVTLAPHVAGRRPLEEVTAEALTLLEKVGLADRAQALPHELSGGQKQRVAIARALAQRPAVLLMDEPTSALDRATATSICDMIRDLTRPRVTLVLVTHQLELATRMADRLLELEHGILSERAAERGPAPGPSRG
jgi:ABC-type polar amino acid transport system ATPase subunit